MNVEVYFKGKDGKKYTNIISIENLIDRDELEEILDKMFPEVKYSTYKVIEA